MECQLPTTNYQLRARNDEAAEHWDKGLRHEEEFQDLARVCRGPALTSGLAHDVLIRPDRAELRHHGGDVVGAATRVG